MSGVCSMSASSFADAISSMGSRGGWVPVSQRLPPSDDSVLACLRGDVREASYWGPDDGWSVEPSPSHWMPMPSPPLETKKRRKA